MILECRHIKLSGGKCGSPALKGKPYCYFHSRMKERAAQPPAALEDIFANLEDKSAVQYGLAAVGRAYAHRRITAKDAGIFTYILQTAMANLKNPDQIISETAVSRIMVENGEEMAPKNATAGPTPEPSFADLLQKEVKKQRKEEAERHRLEEENRQNRLQQNQRFSPDQTPQPADSRDLTGKSEGEGGYRRIFGESENHIFPFGDI